MSFVDFSDFDINAAELQDTGSFDLLPQGWYSGFVEKIEVKETRTGGQMFAATVSITGPTHDGRKIFVNFNWVNANPTAQQIGRQQFAGLVRAVGLQGVQSLDDVVNQPFDCKVGVQKSKDPQYEDRNDIKQYAPYGSRTQQQPAVPVARPQQPAARPAPQRPQPQQPAARPAPRQQPANAAPAKRGAMPWEQAAPQQDAGVENGDYPF